MLPIIELSGSAEERGLAHGSQLKEKIAGNIAFYQKRLGLEESALRGHAEYFASVVEKVRPDLKIEMDAIARGAGVEPVYIYMLNARTELLALDEEAHPECATFFFSKDALLFENWDWSDASKEFPALFHVTLENGTRFVTFTEAGMLGKVGMSSRGFGVAFNYLYPAGPLRGLPVHVLLRMILESDSYENALALAGQEHVGTSGNLMIASATGEAVDFELSGTHTSALPLTGNGFAHTNHYLNSATANDPDAGMGFLNNSYARYERATALIGQAPDKNFADATKILLDRTPGNGMLCRDFLPEEEGGRHLTGTVASMVMDLRNNTFHLALNPQQQSTFSSYQV